MNLKYYFWATCSRKNLDRLQEKYKDIYKGVVLDIGGRDRGLFKKPKNKVKKWIFADIEKENNPDIVLDVADMNKIDDCSIDTISAIQLFEHVLYIEKGVQECHRILKEGGHIVLSAPFLYSIHGDPCDYQRWTLDKWKFELKKARFELEEVEISGFFFSVLADMFRSFVKSMPIGLKQLCYLFFPIMNLLVSIDRTTLVKMNNVLNKFHEGYFIIARKK